MLPPETNTETGESYGPLKESCRRFAAGAFDPDDGKDVRLLLSGEGLKRLESFIFELLFQRVLHHYCASMLFATGWFVLPLNGKAAGLWIRLDAGEGLNPADEALLKLLEDDGSLVLKVRCPKSSFVGSWLTASAWDAERDLHKLLLEKFGVARTTRPPQPGSEERAGMSLEALLSRCTAVERRALSLSRLLINCFIVPYTGMQPMDLDAIALNERGEIRFLEFKRKYPAYGGKFGFDSGHVSLTKWLGSHGLRLTNIILLDPCRTKGASPLHLLDLAGTRKHALWVGANVEPSMFLAEGLRTSGVDSGMFHVDRQQSALHLSAYSVLGQSFAPTHLREFLNGDPVSEVLSEALVEKCRREAATLCSAAAENARM